MNDKERIAYLEKVIGIVLVAATNKRQNGTSRECKEFAEGIQLLCYYKDRQSFLSNNREGLEELLTVSIGGLMGRQQAAERGE